MSKGKTGSAFWKIKNSLSFIFAFIPFLQWIPCFVMNGKLQKKKWLLMGFANVMVIVIFISGLSIDSSVYAKDDQQYKYPETPKLEDYVKNSSDYTYNEYKELPEYKEYKKAYDAVVNSAEYQDVKQKKDALRRKHQDITAAFTAVFFITYLMFLIMIFFVERYRFYRELADSENRQGVYDALRAEGAASGNNRVNQGSYPGTHKTGSQGVQQNPGQDAYQAAVQEVNQSTGQSAGQDRKDDEKINVNTADESQLETLPTISVIDAKRIVDYRNKNGRFNSLDEFFASFDAKPHMIVRIQDMVCLESDAKQAKKESSSAASSRRFDL